MSRERVFEVVAEVGGRAVLVAGQAVAVWAEYYARRGRLPSVGGAGTMYVSKDVDFAAVSLDPRDLEPMVGDLASRLGGRAEHNFAWDSMIVACVKYPRGRVDFLRGVHGSQRDALLSEAIVFHPPEGLDLPSFEIVHPIGLLETRIAVVPADHRAIPAQVREQRLPRCRAKIAAAIARRGAS